ncbi:unnamed protein product [Dimorphilus gyrociliatus]|uniref:Uncharacterized protein n=1 Tax=Dimorphilus gyrociliatus TaxID=2664684 RepID=A0A7I8WEA6_9ANNE|nr:unnamed protein product [Dimorphilus gyrociliatus]
MSFGEEMNLKAGGRLLSSSQLDTFFLPFKLTSHLPAVAVEEKKKVLSKDIVELVLIKRGPQSEIEGYIEAKDKLLFRLVKLGHRRFRSEVVSGGALIKLKKDDFLH